MKYCVLISGNGFTVRNYECETDYSAEIEETFNKFKQGAAKDYLAKYRSSPDEMNHVEAKILDFVAKLHSDLFSRLRLLLRTEFRLYRRNDCGFRPRDTVLCRIPRTRLQVRAARIAFLLSEPVHRVESGACASDAFDLALAQKLLSGGASIVCNDFVLNRLRADHRRHRS